MALRLNQEVIHGWIDNTGKGKVVGEIFIEGHEKPVKLELIGNCDRDLAGSKCSFRNPKTEKNPYLEIASKQIGKVGDITGSRRCRVPEETIEEFYVKSKQGLSPKEHWANVLYLEWFSKANGRVVIEIPDIEIDVTLPVWKMSEEEEKQQKKENMQTMTSWADDLYNSMKPVRLANMDREEMDEFEWELLLQESDAKTAKFGELMDKYQDEENLGKIIDEQMGWTINADLEEANLNNFSDVDEYEDSLSERKKHPLAERISNLSVYLYQRMQEFREKVGEDGLDHITDMMADLKFEVQFGSAKIGSVLNDSSYYQKGMIIAKMKRGMVGIQNALNLTANEALANAIPDIVEVAKAELFIIREEAIRVMNELRK